jgi:limonene-1,2-epoxide hydrolase
VSDDNSPAEVVARFIDAWPGGDPAHLASFFTDDAVYHNIPLAPVKGKDAIKGTLETFVPQSPAVEFVMLNIASSGPVVFTERVDKMTFGGKRVELPVAGVFEISGGKITAWRDYFDLQQFMNPPGQ